MARPNKRKCADCPRFMAVYFWWWDAELGADLPVCEPCSRERMKRAGRLIGSART